MSAGMSVIEDRLRSGLADLAEDPVPPADQPTAGQLWSAGRSRGRSRARGTGVVLVVTCLLLASVLVGSWAQARPDGSTPAGATDRVAIPARFHEPSPWLPGTGDQPPGRLVAITPAERGTWTGKEPGLVGVSAAAGAYRFLDLPDLAAPEEAAISPDGLHVAFWTIGTPSGTARRDQDAESGPTVTGYAVYDTIDGRVRRHDVDTAFGLDHSPFYSSLLWADDEHLVVGHGQVQGEPGDEDGAVSTGFETWVWSVGTGAPRESEPRRLPRAFPGSIVGSTGAGDLVVSAERGRGRGQRYDLVGLDGTRQPGPTPGPVTAGPVFDATGSRFAVVPGPAIPGPLRVADLGDGRDVLPTRVRGVAAVDGWRRDGRLVVTQVSFRTSRAQFSVVDPDTGRTTRLARLDPSEVGALQLAAGLLDAPVVDSPAPPSPWDPRAVAGSVAAIAALGVLALWSWRRRPVVLG